MATKLRLQRHGRKGKPIFTIVAADSKVKRDGKYIEKIGQYNPNTNPATIDLDFDAALTWMQNGAQPSDTVRAILSYKGVLYKKHLLEGVKKGALTLEQVEAKFDAWLQDKEGKITGKKENLASAKASAKAAQLEAEKASVEAKAAAAVQAAEAATAEVAEEVAEEAPAVEAAAEEAPAAEASEENTEA